MADQCRLCMSAEGAAVDIFANNANGESSVQLISAIFGIQLDFHENKPSQACHPCAKLLRDIRKLRTTIESAQNHYQERLEHSIEADQDQYQDDGPDHGASDDDYIVEESIIEESNYENDAPVYETTKAKSVSAPKPLLPPVITGAHEIVPHIDPTKLGRRPQKKKAADVQCPHCPKKLTTKLGLRLHLSRVHGIGLEPVICDVCGKSFKDNSYLKQHIALTHTAKKTEECPFCHRHLFNIKDHIDKVHGRRRKYEQCNKCGKQTISMYTHALSCMVERTEVCDVCGATFKTPKALEIHKDIHLGIRNQCMFCPYAAPGPRNLNTHYRQKHPAEYEEHKAKKYLPRVKGDFKE